jgi:hypothetical protein
MPAAIGTLALVPVGVVDVVVGAGVVVVGVGVVVVLGSCIATVNAGGTPDSEVVCAPSWLAANAPAASTKERTMTSVVFIWAPLD